ncbi:type 2 periplasmic-binding domain-containing protein [Agromyces kandeliae]|uniref:Carbohydrate ABC transporter substrate-binding protein n=1 Tax=Agromyces kandeliae TaxID=2666141 RepID=A0A6L5R420_9MICO|nr:carbohydrate ABC transporter substrate-binding protein [Agromyces kandeliae]MRX44729.1 carbohydrate ABC transporter substrate-binding protein [Agromyces kandeliae]
MPARYRGLTWDHPRGRLALERAAETATDAAGAPLIAWDVHPLEGFESSPIEDLAARYDVIVLDHPHLGDALEAGAIRPLDEWFAPEFLDAVRVGAVGPSAASYTLDGRLWALPLDAATQVAVRVPELVPVAPETWAEVLELSTTAPVALSLAGPHAFLTFASTCVALGGEPAVEPGSGLVDRAVGAQALGIMAELAARMPERAADLNPIALLERMRRERDIAYVPLVYGYVTYASGPGALAFDDAPAASSGRRRGSTIGGTGIALSTRSEPDQALLAHLAGLLDPVAQRTSIPEHAGQPGLRSAWTDDAVNAASADFYRSTLATIDDAWVRPRVPGYIPFQSAASAIVRRALLEGGPADAALADLDRGFDALARERSTVR